MSRVEMADLAMRLVAEATDCPTSVGAVRRLATRWTPAFSDLNHAVAVATAIRLVPHGSSCRHLAYELLLRHPTAVDHLSPRAIESLAGVLDSWGAVDTFAYLVVGPAWQRKRFTLATARKWARSADPWWRRAALVATIPLNIRARGGRGAPTETLAIASLLVADRSPAVVKAMSWALRALSTQAPQDVRNFLSEHADSLHVSVLRDVRTKLVTGRKRVR